MVAIAAGIAVAAGVMWWLHVFQYESTDDAFVDARTVAVSSQITGVIIDLPITDNQVVDADGVLVRIDPRDYETALAQAKAQVAHADAAISSRFTAGAAGFFRSAPFSSSRSKAYRNAWGSFRLWRSN
jgi:membrane fusion protein, multidrug efflux system